MILLNYLTTNAIDIIWGSFLRHMLVYSTEVIFCWWLLVFFLAIVLLITSLTTCCIHCTPFKYLPCLRISFLLFLLWEDQICCLELPCWLHLLLSCFSHGDSFHSFISSFHFITQNVPHDMNVCIMASFLKFHSSIPIS